MQKVIGLDIGSYSIKAIEIINTFKSYEITNFYETVVPKLDGVPLDAVVPICMEQLFSENNLDADRIITAMPGQFISSRVLSFNFADPRKIDTSIMAELEDFVPFNMDDMIVDHQVLGTIGGKTLVLAVMTRKAFLKNFLDLLKRIQIDPKLVDIDSLAFYNLSSFMNLENNKCVALVDIGHEKTAVCIVRDGVLRMFRSINLGGRYITEFLARDLETDYHDAQRIKHLLGRVLCQDDMGEDLDAKDKKIVERMTLASNAIVKELGRTFYSYKTWDQEPIDKVIISGGTSKMLNLEKFLSEQLEVKAEKLNLERTSLKIGPGLTEVAQVMPQSLAIGLRAVSNIKKHSQINLRRDEFAYVQDYESIMKGATAAFRVVAFAITLLMVSYMFKYYFYSKQIDEVQDLYLKEFLTAVPDVKKKYKVKPANFNIMRKDAEDRLRLGIMERRNAISEFQMASQGSGALRLLQEISAALPKDLVIDVTLFDFKMTVPGKGKLQLRAETDNFATQSSIIDALKKVAVLKNVQEKDSGTKPGSDGKKIEFTINADYETGAGAGAAG